jgi:hypothetical protein
MLQSEAWRSRDQTSREVAQGEQEPRQPEPSDRRIRRLRTGNHLNLLSHAKSS